MEIPLGKGIAGYVAKMGVLTNVEDAYTDSRFEREVDLKTGYRTKSVLCCPVKDHDGQVIGVIQALNKYDPTRATHMPLDPSKVISTASGISCMVSFSMFICMMFMMICVCGINSG